MLQCYSTYRHRYHAHALLIVLPLTGTEIDRTVPGRGSSTTAPIALPKMNMSIATCSLMTVLACHTSEAFMVTQTFPILPPCSMRLESISDIDFHSDMVHDRRRNFVVLSLSITAALLGQPTPVSAGYGDSSSIKIPTLIDYLIEKNASVDSSAFLYKGEDSGVQLKRILDATKRLGEIPDMARSKKWSQVQGILTGPLGTLVQTMNLVSKDSAEAKKAAAVVKSDLIKIGEAATKRSDTGCIDATVATTRDLEAFVKIVF